MYEALRCVDEGIAPKTIDAALVAFGMPMGPVELVDTRGARYRRGRRQGPCRRRCGAAQGPGRPGRGRPAWQEERAGLLCAGRTGKVRKSPLRRPPCRQASPGASWRRCWPPAEVCVAKGVVGRCRSGRRGSYIRHRFCAFHGRAAQFCPWPAGRWLRLLQEYFMSDAPVQLPADKLPVLRVMPMPRDLNPAGDVFGGWIMSQVDIAGAAAGHQAGPQPRGHRGGEFLHLQATHLGGRCRQSSTPISSECWPQLDHGRRGRLRRTKSGKPNRRQGDRSRSSPMLRWSVPIASVRSESAA
jgi:hypothetical protein